MATRSRRWPEPDAERRWTRAFTRQQQQQQEEEMEQVTSPDPPVRDQQPAAHILPSTAGEIIGNDLPQPVHLHAVDQEPSSSGAEMDTSTSTVADGNDKSNNSRK